MKKLIKIFESVNLDQKEFEKYFHFNKTWRSWDLPIYNIKSTEKAQLLGFKDSNGQEISSWFPNNSIKGLNTLSGKLSEVSPTVTVIADWIFANKDKVDFANLLKIRAKDFKEEPKQEEFKELPANIEKFLKTTGLKGVMSIKIDEGNSSVTINDIVFKTISNSKVYNKENNISLDFADFYPKNYLQIVLQIERLSGSVSKVLKKYLEEVYSESFKESKTSSKEKIESYHLEIIREIARLNNNWKLNLDLNQV